jgi:hypothetical protein
LNRHYYNIPIKVKVGIIITPIIGNIDYE